MDLLRNGALAHRSDWSATGLFTTHTFVKQRVFYPMFTMDLIRNGALAHRSGQSATRVSKTHTSVKQCFIPHVYIGFAEEWRPRTQEWPEGHRSM